MFVKFVVIKIRTIALQTARLEGAFLQLLMSLNTRKFRIQQMKVLYYILAVIIGFSLICCGLSVADLCNLSIAR